MGLAIGLCVLSLLLNHAGCLVSFEDYPVGPNRDAGSSGGGSDASDAACNQTEVCDGIDNDCSGAVDEDDVCPSDCVGRSRAGRGYMFCARLATQAEAASACAEGSMQLVAVEDEAENNWLYGTSLNLGIIVPTYIGASDIETEGRWSWANGIEFWIGGANGSASPDRYAEWGMDEPNNRGGAENCGVIRELGYWNDVPCLERNAFICEGS